MSAASRLFERATSFHHQLRQRAAFAGKRVRPARLAANALEPLEQRMMLTAVHWTGLGDGTSWSDGQNWDTLAKPGNGDDVTISVAADPTILFNAAAGAANLNSLVSDEAINFTGGTFHATTFTQNGKPISISSGTIQGGTLTLAGGAAMLVNGTAGVLDGVTVNGDIDLATTNLATIDLRNTVTVNGRISIGNLAGTTRGNLAFGGVGLTGGTLAGNAEVLFGANASNFIGNYNGTGAATATLGANVVIHGHSGQIFNNYAAGVIVNQGQINADVSGGTISFNGATFTNNGSISAAAGTTVSLTNFWTNAAAGTITATGATLALGYSFNPWSNPGSITAANSTVNITGSYSSDIFLAGHFTRTGGTVNVSGALNNAGKTIALNAALGSWNLVGVTITGGTINASAGSMLVATATDATFDGLTLNGDLDIAANHQAAVDIKNTVTVNGKISVGNLAGTTRGILEFGGAALTGGTLAGNAEVLFGGHASNLIINYNNTAPATATLGPNVVVHGKNGQINNNYAGGNIVNQGQINADVSGGQISFSGATFTNNGSISAAAGTTVSLTNLWTNAATGTITASGATLALGYSFNLWSNPGSITASNSTVNITGTYSSDVFLAGHFTRTGGTVNVSGALNNAGKTIALNAALGSWNLVGVTITGGTIDASAGSMLVATATDATFDGLTLNGDLDIASISQAAVDIKNTVTVNGKISVGNLAGTTRGILEFGGAALTGGTLTGNAEVLFGGNVNNIIINYNNTLPATATLGPNVVVHGKSGQINNNYANGVIVNQGQINADVSGGQISFNGATFINNGAMTAAAGTTLGFYNLWTNNGTIVANGATLNLGLSTYAWANNNSIAANNTTVNITGSYAGPGNFVRTGGVVNLAGLFNNTGKVLNLNASLGSWNLVGVAITGGTINASAGSMLVATATDATFDGLTYNGDLDIATNNQAAVDIKNTVTINGKITVGNAAVTTRGILEFGSAALTGGTLTGNAEVLFGGNANNVIINYNNTGAATANLGPSVLVHGKSGQINNNYAGGTIASQATIKADAAGAAFSVNGGKFSSAGSLISGPGANFAVNVAATLIDLASLSGTGSFSFASNALGDTDNAGLFNPQGATTLNAHGTALNPQQFEAMSADLGAVAAGLVGNFAYGTIKLGGTNYVKLVDLSNNAAGAGAEAVYAGAVLVPTGSTLDLNGLHLYTRSATVAGSVLNGTISIIPSGGDLPLNTPTTGVLLISGATDQWTFFGHAGQTFTIGVNPGAGSGLAPITPLLNWADVQLVGPGSQLLASGFSAASGAGVTLPATALPSDGTYTVVVKAAAGHTASVGNYVVTAYDVNPTVRPLALNQVLYGNIASPLSTDQWSFSAPAGLQVQFHLASAGATGKGFTLTGPGGYTGFTNLAGDSGIVTLPTAGTYTLTAQSLDGSTGAYAFQLNQVTVNTLPLNGSVGGTLPGSGTSQIYKVTLPVAKPLVVTLDDASSADRVEVYLKQGSLPTRGSYDYKYGSANAADQKVLVPRASAGDWYVLVYGDFVPAPSTFTLSSAATDVQLTGVTPDSYGAAGTLNMTLTGSGFVPGATVRLVAANTTTYAPTNLVIDSYTHATATFNAGAIPVGVYSVRVTLPNADTSTLAGALTLTPPVAGGQPRLETQLIMPSALGRHAAATIYLEYANTGDVAMPAPMIQVGSADPNGTDKPMLTLDASRILYGLYTAALPEGYGTSINILASGEQPGVLNPGERIRVPIYYAGLLRPWDFSDTKVELGMAVVRASDLTPMDGLRGPAGHGAGPAAPPGLLARRDDARPRRRPLGLARVHQHHQRPLPRGPLRPRVGLRLGLAPQRRRRRHSRDRLRRRLARALRRRHPQRRQVPLPARRHQHARPLGLGRVRAHRHRRHRHPLRRRRQARLRAGLQRQPRLRDLRRPGPARAPHAHQRRHARLRLQRRRASRLHHRLRRARHHLRLRRHQRLPADRDDLRQQDRPVHLQDLRRRRGPLRPDLHPDAGRHPELRLRQPRPARLHRAGQRRPVHRLRLQRHRAGHRRHRHRHGLDRLRPARPAREGHRPARQRHQRRLRRQPAHHLAHRAHRRPPVAHLERQGRPHQVHRRAWAHRPVRLRQPAQPPDDLHRRQRQRHLLRIRLARQPDQHHLRQQRLGGHRRLLAPGPARQRPERPRAGDRHHVQRRGADHLAVLRRRHVEHLRLRRPRQPHLRHRPQRHNHLRLQLRRRRRPPQEGHLPRRALPAVHLRRQRPAHPDDRPGRPGDQVRLRRQRQALPHPRRRERAPRDLRLQPLRAARPR
ncbi:MAG: hypothetical protein NTW19_09595 [Planctomycetota bacterium]|nr:hypothetical protein [Planctomycetota bacterium]